jgi:uncharacterized protein (UPF0276 family)
MHPSYSPGKPLIGVAYTRSAGTLVKDFPNEIDYVEVPFELLRNDPAVLELRHYKPIILHCASLSMGGTVRPGEQTEAQVADWIRRTETPWLGEHLSYITALKPDDLNHWDEYASGEPYNIGYTVSPPMNDEAVQTVLAALERASRLFPVPVLLENPPLYFIPPGSTMPQVEFIRRICDAGGSLLLDLSHFLISCHTVGVDHRQELRKLPLSKVVEIHLSGIDYQDGGYWDHHAAAVPEAVLNLLAVVLERATPKAVTLEFNWPSTMVEADLLREIDRVRRIVSGGNAA